MHSLTPIEFVDGVKGAIESIPKYFKEVETGMPINNEWHSEATGNG